MLVRIIPALRYLERFIRPRWPTPFEITKRVVGVVVLLLGVCLLAPIPLSNLPVSLTIVLVAFAYLEEDGLTARYCLDDCSRPVSGRDRGAMEHGCGRWSG